MKCNNMQQISAFRDSHARIWLYSDWWVDCSNKCYIVSVSIHRVMGDMQQVPCVDVEQLWAKNAALRDTQGNVVAVAVTISNPLCCCCRVTSNRSSLSRLTWLTQFEATKRSSWITLVLCLQSRDSCNSWEVKSRASVAPSFFQNVKWQAGNLFYASSSFLIVFLFF